MLMRTVDILIPVYNAAGGVPDICESLRQQHLDADVELRVFVVDDGSDNRRAAETLGSVASAVTVIRHERNRGRAAARNTGARAGRGEYLVFVDADCSIEDEHFIMRHLRAIEGGADVSVGSCAAQGNSFLAAFERRVNARRASGPAWLAFTSANFAIRRRAFEGCGGFDERYRWYGFEDRDLAARLVVSGYLFHVTREATVHHRDASTAAGLLRRLEEAGETSSGIFLRDHPRFYAQLHYSHFDFRLHPYRSRTLYALAVVVRPLLHAFAARAVSGSSSAFALKAFTFRVAAAVAYLSGTRRAWLKERR